MKLHINGQLKDISGSSQTIAGIVAQFCKDSKNIMTELNGSIIPSSEWEKTMLKENDAVELVSFVGGG